MLDADRTTVPVQVLSALGHWAYVTTLDNDTWVDLMGRTLQLTDGAIQNVTEIADQCKNRYAAGSTVTMVRLLLGNREPWAQNHVARIALDVLRLAVQRPVEDDFWDLRTRLIELGYHDAAELKPNGDESDDGSL